LGKKYVKCHAIPSKTGTLIGNSKILSDPPVLITSIYIDMMTTNYRHRNEHIENVLTDVS